MIGFISNFGKRFEIFVAIHKVRDIQNCIILINHRAVIMGSIKYHKIHIFRGLHTSEQPDRIICEL
jgi:hypothetical protein